MIDTPDQHRVQIADLVLRLRQAGIADQRIVSAIEGIPRDLFVRPDYRNHAYLERALPIDCGQTISAPVVVGMMTAALDVSDRDKVLEVGTGSGYQAAVLSKLVRRVFTIERFLTLVASAESRFQTLRLSNITTMVGDGTLGCPQQAPFDAIAITAACEQVPDALLEQVRVGGVIVAPVGPLEGVQRLMRLERGETGFDETVLADVRFVPLIAGKAAAL